MANTYPITFDDKSYLSKVKLGNETYYVKDADLRAIVAQFGTAADQNVAQSIGENVPGLATGMQVYEFVLDRTADLAGAMHFIGQSTTDPTSVGGPTISGHTGDYEAGDVCIYGVIEYVYDGTNWQELGDEGTWVPKSRTIAGLDLQDNITVAELKSALSLASLAYANTASTTVTDYATGISGATYTPEGTISATVGSSSASATLTTEDYTPAGSVTGTVTPTGSVSISKDTVSGTQISGSNAASSVSITPTTESVLKGVKTAAVAPTFTEGAYTPGSFTKGTAVTAATEGLVATIGTGNDAETLIFSTANTDSVMDYDATYTPGSKAADTFTAGSAPTFDSQTVWTGYSAATAAAQTFTGDKFAATFTGNSDTINADFSGTTVEDAIVTGVAYDKTTVSDLAFTGTEATITPTLTKGNKTITVSPDAV